MIRLLAAIVRQHLKVSAPLHLEEEEEGEDEEKQQQQQEGDSKLHDPVPTHPCKKLYIHVLWIFFHSTCYMDLFPHQ